MQRSNKFSSPLLKRYLLTLGTSVLIVSAMMIYFGSFLERIYSISQSSAKLEYNIVRISHLEQQFFLKKLKVPFEIGNEDATLLERNQLVEETRKITPILLKKFYPGNRQKVTELSDAFEHHVQAFDLFVSEYNQLLDPNFISQVHSNARKLEHELESRGDQKALLEFLRLQRSDHIALQWDLHNPIDRKIHLRTLFRRIPNHPGLKQDLKKYEENYQEYQRRYGIIGFNRESGQRRRVYQSAVEMHHALAEMNQIRFNYDEQLHRDVYLCLVFFLLIVVGLGVFFFKFTATSFANPVNSLAQYIIRLGEGELNATPPDSKTSEEFHYLIHTLQEMAKKLESTMVSRQELFKSQALLETVLLGIRDGIVTVDLNGNLLYINRVAAELFETEDPQSMIGQNYENVLNQLYLYFDETGAPIPLEEMPTSAALRGAARLPLTYRAKSKSGDKPDRWASSQAISLCDEHQKLCYIVTVIKDITQQKKAEEMMEQQRAQLAHSTRLSAIGVMAAGIAHEINNPLSVIQRRAEQITESLSESDPDFALIQSNSEKIVTFSQRIAKIIRSLKNLSRNGEHDPFETVSIQALIDDCLELCRERFKSNGVDLQLDLPSTDFEIECCPTQVSQVLVNLLSNALDAVQTHPTMPQKWVRVEATKRDSIVVIRVCDSGPGVPSELREKIGIPFFTTKEAGKGTGLGLSVSSRFVESHHGTLKLDHTSPFTAFEIQLPLVQPQKSDLSDPDISATSI